MVVSWEKFSNRIDPSLNKNKHFELSSEKDTFVKKESDFYPKEEKNACYNLIIVIVFDQEVVILPMNSHLLWFDWQVKELTDILVKLQTKFKTPITFQMPKRRKLTGI